MKEKYKNTDYPKHEIDKIKNEKTKNHIINLLIIVHLRIMNVNFEIYKQRRAQSFKYTK